MSRAFVKEDGGEPWRPPAPLREIQIWLGGEMVHETDDLQDALNWLWARPAGLLDAGFAVKTREGRLLAEG